MSQTHAVPIRIWPGNVQGTPALEARVHRALSRVLRRFGPRMTVVEAHFEQLTRNARKCRELCCVMEAHVNHRGPIAVQSCGDDLYHSIDAAGRKLEAAIDRVIARHHARASL